MNDYELLISIMCVIWSWKAIGNYMISQWIIVFKGVWKGLCINVVPNRRFWIEKGLTLSEAMSETDLWVCIVSNWSKHQSNSSIVSRANFM